MGTSTYVYSNTSPHAVTHHRLLGEILDPVSKAQLARLQRPLTGMACLEVGAGPGSMALWLARQVGGPPGRVVATDLHPMPIPGAKGLTVIAHDITAEAIPRQPYDLIHVRLLLMHLPERVEVLRRLVHALAPGGALVVGDWDQSWTLGRVLHAPSRADGDLFEQFHDAALAILQSRGRVDPGWANATFGAMVDAGLRDVETQLYSRSWRGGTAWPLFLANSAHQLHDELIHEGLSPEDLARIDELMHEPTMVVRSPLAYFTVGYR